jgi:NADH-quinone oxidoreductase subunit J
MNFKGLLFIAAALAVLLGIAIFAPDFKSGIFYVFAAVLVVAALLVVTARNPIHSALFLVLAFFSAAAIWMLLQAEFLAIVLVLVYVGAVMVLFLFVVMMLDINLDKMREGFWGYLPVAATVGVVIVLEMAFVLIKTFIVHDVGMAALPAGSSNTRELGKLIFTDYIFGFEVAALILLVAIVAAVALTLRKRKDTKGQVPSQQVLVKRSDRVRMVSMPSEKK